jgi:predicted nuclease of restriction endonuclease-like (RecB) superfamily
MKKDRRLAIKTYNNLLERIAEILNQARTKVIREINRAQVLAYWAIGREIVEFEQKGRRRAEYGKKVLIRLSEDLTQKFGKGFSVDNLQLMRRFYLTYPDKFQIYETMSRKSQKSETLSNKSVISQMLSEGSEPILSWSHYCELLKIEEPLARSFYEREAIQNNWSVSL